MRTNDLTFDEQYSDSRYFGVINHRGVGIGSALLTEFPKSFPKPVDVRKLFYFDDLHINSRFRGHGFGAVLLEKVLEFGQREGVSILNEPIPYDGGDGNKLLRFYLSHGFKRIDSDESLIWIPRGERK